MASDKKKLLQYLELVLLILTVRIGIQKLILPSKRQRKNYSDDRINKQLIG